MSESTYVFLGGRILEVLLRVSSFSKIKGRIGDCLINLSESKVHSWRIWGVKLKFNFHLWQCCFHLWLFMLKGCFLCLTFPFQSIKPMIYWYLKKILGMSNDCQILELLLTLTKSKNVLCYSHLVDSLLSDACTIKMTDDSWSIMEGLVPMQPSRKCATNELCGGFGESISRGYPVKSTLLSKEIQG